MTGAIPNWLLQRATTHRNHPAVIVEDRTLTYEQLAKRACGLANSLKEKGLTQGGRVGLLAGSSAESVAAVHAVSIAGGVLVPLNARLTTEEISWQVRNVQASLLLCDGDMGPRAGDVSAAASMEPPLLLRESEVDLVPELAHNPADVHSIIHTSGTTGMPKGAMLTFGNFAASAAGSAENLGVSPDDRWVACMPLFHVGGLSILLRSAIHGTTVDLHENFEPNRVNRALRHDGVTLLSVVPTMLQRMLDANDATYPSSVRAVLVGGGPVSEEVLRRALDRGLPVVQTYGLTEATSQVATLAPGEALSYLGSAGRPLASTSVRIDGEAGEPGEILVRGPAVTPGYWGDPESSARAIRDGWLYTGDIGRLDEGGYLTVLDRRDDLIVSGGENIYPTEVEAVLESHPYIEAAALIGLPDAQWGQKAVAAVVAVGALEEKALLNWLDGRIARYKIPKAVHTVDSLPRTASGKLQRRKVRDLLAGPQEQSADSQHL